MISLAYKESAKSTCRYKHGAIIVKSGSVVSQGHNKYRTHPRWGSGPLMCVHAEGDAIRNAVRQRINIEGANIYITRRSTFSRMSKPCTDCMARIKKYGIRKVIYTDVAGNIITEWP
jgi:deoxycytidylate deaminase